LKRPGGEKIFEAYAEQSTPAAYSIFWYYGPDKNKITILSTIPPPEWLEKDYRSIKGGSGSD